ncbi:hypothetical protein GQ43DRAFT_450719 [Delitschia confertaspora ATCC 74209]|uniref:Glycosyltransferase 2-like domain-containing protein n=1 Tax=Delitschia confertaspora ATCC 74209 TaxID=1513339 RepID=A0A9P4JLT7_9PLEO|nr:hypothetical protein GQ43DRAFT_450719 [Delitschia confertaspora ATCC 74209]
MVQWLHTQQEQKMWTTGGPGQGVVLKQAKGCYVCSPNELRTDNSHFFDTITLLNVRAAMTVNSRVIQLILEQTIVPYVEITPGLRLQIVPNIASLLTCQKHQFAAFVSSPKMLVVWDDEPKKLPDRAAKIEGALMRWGAPQPLLADKEKTLSKRVSTAQDGIFPIQWDDPGVEEPEVKEKRRGSVLIQPVLSACTLILTLAALGGGFQRILIEILVDHNYLRILFVLTVLPQAWLGMFFFQAIVGNIIQIIGPTSQLRQNTRFYSGIAPRRLKRTPEGLPHVTIQMPVFKEGLHTVIEPTIRSIKAAISVYELQGGTANIFVNDDGMRHLNEADAQERKEFYEEHSIGWVARPKHNPKPKQNEERVFLRRGKFKKASNMNYGLSVSVEIEKRLEKLERHRNWTQIDENAACINLLQDIVKDSDGEIWAEGNIRIGDYILLIDSDTRVPNDCFLDAVSEMEQSPQVAVLQYSSGVMNVTDNFFERGVTFFTHLIYTQIRYAVANGDVAPFVGHNAIIRWSAMQDIAYYCTDDKREKYWSECTVSEDFDMALRLQAERYLIRFAAYKGDGFKEGVSITVYDELQRWEKYAYGCCELVFRPMKYWIYKGPFTTLFWKFLFSSIPLPSKLTTLAYIGTYFALGSAWILTLLNYFLTGWYNEYLDHYYVDSFKVYFAIIMIFTGMGNIALATLRYRLQEQFFFASLWQNFTWIPLLAVFLGGVSLHISQALLYHLLSIDMTWGATNKEAEHVGFFEELPRVWKRFRGTFIYCGIVGMGMVCCACVVPEMWQVRFFTAIWPLASSVGMHALLPVALNPNLMLFTW